MFRGFIEERNARALHLSDAKRKRFMLKVRLQHLGDTAILHLQGGIVIGNTAILHNAALSQPGLRVLVLDMTQVNRIDAGGLGVLLELREYLQSRAIDLKLMNVPALIRQVLEITRLDSIFEIIADDQPLSSSLIKRIGRGRNWEGVSSLERPSISSLVSDDELVES
jgi:anti-anti-sigma factor